MDTLAGLWTIKNIDVEKSSVAEMSLVSKALKRLNELNWCNLRKRFRAGLSEKEPVKEELHTIKDYRKLIKAFTADTTINKYNKQLHKQKTRVALWGMRQIPRGFVCSEGFHHYANICSTIFLILVASLKQKRFLS